MTTGVDPISLLLQGGLVGVFMIFVIFTRREDHKERQERDLQWQTFLQQQNAANVENMRLVSETLQDLVRKFDEHDTKVTSGFAVLTDRVQGGRTQPQMRRKANDG